MDLATIYERTGQGAKADALLHQAPGPEAQPVLQEKKKEREFQRSLARFDELIAREKGEEALALMELLVRDAPSDMKPGLQTELLNLRVFVEDIRMVNRYNQAGELMAKGKYPEALAAFEEVAATAREPELAASARKQVDWLRRRLGERKPKRQAP
ncbi:MAG: hypothetical protein ABR576_11510 [Thermoanaerobaculia bacterium]